MSSVCIDVTEVHIVSKAVVLVIQIMLCMYVYVHTHTPTFACTPACDTIKEKGIRKRAKNSLSFSVFLKDLKMVERGEISH